MRFDGYYILTDLLDMPNLQQHSVMHLKYLLERFAFRKQDAQKVAETWSEAVIFTIYGISSAVYRFFLFAGFIIAASQHYLILSVIMGAMLLLSMVVMPVGKFLKYVFNSPALTRVRLRAVTISVIFFGSLFAALFYIPVPDTFTAPGVLEAKQFEDTIVATSGRVSKVYHQSGDFVAGGDTLVVLQNEELGFTIDEKNAEINEAVQQYYKALNETPENMYPLEKRIEVLRQELEELKLQKDRLVMVAGMDGIWNVDNIDDFVDKWVSKGDSLGMLLDTTAFNFLAVVSQEEVSRLFMGTPRRISVRLKGDSFYEILVDSAYAIPASIDKLPSSALGWHGGGDIETRMGKDATEQTAEPVYLVRASLRLGKAEVHAMHGRSGKIRFHLGDTPLALQGIRKVEQALQKYYRM
jgi:putative peptide zinc metalloprotease protein